MSGMIEHHLGYTALSGGALGKRVAAMVREAYEAGAIRPGRKCCKKCAFRAGSPERSDPYAWLNLVEGLAEGRGIFLCHETIPGHRQQVPGTGLRVCAGFHALRYKPPSVWLRLGRSERP